MVWSGQFLCFQSANVECTPSTSIRSPSANWAYIVVLSSVIGVLAGCLVRIIGSRFISSNTRLIVESTSCTGRVTSSSTGTGSGR